MTIPTITPFPVAPSRLDTRDVFNAKVAAWLAAERTLPGEINAFAAALDALGSVQSLGVVGPVADELTVGSGPIAFSGPATRGWYHGFAGVLTADDDVTVQMLVLVDTYDGATGAVTGVVPDGQTAGVGTFTGWTFGPASSGTTVGKQTIPLPAGHWQPRTTNGAAVSLDELATNKVMRRGIKFSGTVQKYIQCTIPMPKSWDCGHMTARFFGEHGAIAGANGVVMAIQAMARGAGDASDAAFGASVSAALAGATADQCQMSAETAAFDASGAPQALDLVTFQVTRLVADAGDTMAEDFILTAVHINIVTDAETDA